MWRSVATTKRAPLPPSLTSHSPRISLIFNHITVRNDILQSHFWLPRCCTRLVPPLWSKCGKQLRKVPTLTHIFPGLSTSSEWGRARCPLADASQTHHPISFNFTVITPLHTGISTWEAVRHLKLRVHATTRSPTALVDLKNAKFPPPSIAFSREV